LTPLIAIHAQMNAFFIGFAAHVKKGFVSKTLQEVLNNSIIHVGDGYQYKESHFI
jgi:hypothetical protein